MPVIANVPLNSVGFVEGAPNMHWSSVMVVTAEFTSRHRTSGRLKMLGLPGRLAGVSHAHGTSYFTIFERSSKAFATATHRSAHK
eukprot:12388263-Heterocapsa_arctica.AAC.1